MAEDLIGMLGVHGGNIRKARAHYGFPKEVLDFSANINPLGLASSIKSAILQELDDIVNYPDPEAAQCKQAIAGYYGLPVQQVVIGNGAVELIYLLAHLLRPQRVLIPAPTFSEYERAIRSVDGEIDYFPLQDEGDFRIDPELFIHKLNSVHMCFLCNPNNPIGNIMQQATLEKIISGAAQFGVWVVLDESFMDFVPNSAEITCRHLVSRYDNLIIIHSLTKFFAIPGLRLGFGVMPEEVARSLELAKDPWNVNSLAQIAAVSALQDRIFISDTVTLIQMEKQFMFHELNKIAGITAYWPTVNFVCFRLNHPQFNSRALADATARRGILIRDCSSFPGLDDHYVRVAVKQRAENQRLLCVLRDLLGEK